MNSRIYRHESFAIAAIVISAGVLAAVYAHLDYKFFVGTLVFTAAAIFFVRVAPSHALPIYFVYLTIDGPIRMFSQYHTATILASDAVLIITFAVLFVSRFHNAQFRRLPSKLKYQINTVFGLIAVFWAWVLLQGINPWGLGVYAVLVAFKAYVVPVFVFIAVVYFAKDEELRILPFVMLSLCLLHAIVAIIDVSLGIDFWPQLEPFYIERYKIFQIGSFGDSKYRPFGLTPSPGMPQTWMSVGMVVAGFTAHNIAADKHLTRRFKAFWYTLIILYVPIGFFTLLVCQVRIGLIRSVAILLAALLLANNKIRGATLLIFPVIVIGFLSLSTHTPNRVDPTGMEAQLSTSLKRAQTLGTAETLKSSRHGALMRIFQIAEHTILGLGVGRGSVHQGVLKDRQNADVRFGHWGWTDNVYNFLFLEIGLFGLLSWIILLIVIVVCLISIPCAQRCLVAAFVAVVALSGLGSETPFPQPEASLFWLMLGLGLRYHPTKLTQT